MPFVRKNISTKIKQYTVIWKSLRENNENKTKQ